MVDLDTLAVGDEITFLHSSGEIMTGQATGWTLGGLFVFVTSKGPKGTAYRVTAFMIRSARRRGVQLWPR